MTEILFLPLPQGQIIHKLSHKDSWYKLLAEIPYEVSHIKDGYAATSGNLVGLGRDVQSAVINLCHELEEQHNA